MGRVVVAGGTGFLGRAVVRALLASGRDVVVLSRKPASASNPADAQVTTLHWDARTPGEWSEALEGAEAVANFSGEPILQPWTAERWQRIVESRVGVAETLGRAILAASDPPKAWLNASAVGIYGDTAARITDESAPLGSDRLAELTAAWEAPLAQPPPETRTIALRIGFVLGTEGGAFPPLAKAARWFMGGRLGNGRQFVPWIHVDDLARSAVWCIDHRLEGPVNVVGPEPCTNAELMAAFRAAVRRPAALPVPGFVLKLIRALTKVPADTALISSRVVPAKLVESGFQFRYASLTAAITACLARNA